MGIPRTKTWNAAIADGLSMTDAARIDPSNPSTTTTVEVTTSTVNTSSYVRRDGSSCLRMRKTSLPSCAAVTRP